MTDYEGFQRNWLTPSSYCTEIFLNMLVETMEIPCPRANLNHMSSHLRSYITAILGCIFPYLDVSYRRSVFTALVIKFLPEIEH